MVTILLSVHCRAFVYGNVVCLACQCELLWACCMAVLLYGMAFPSKSHLLYSDTNWLAVCFAAVGINLLMQMA